MNNERKLIIIIELEHIHSLSICFQHLNILKKISILLLDKYVYFCCDVQWFEKYLWNGWKSLSFFSVNPQSTCLILIIGNEFYVHVIENIIRVSTLQNFSPFLSPTYFLSLTFGILFIEPYSQKHSNSFDFHYFFTCSIISWLYK